MALRISTTTKHDGIRSWSLEALTTCPGSKNPDGSLVAACSGCYATTGNYRFANVKASRKENQEDWKREDWVDDMVNALAGDQYFRWFDSGDMYSLSLAEKIYEVMSRTPWVKHWLPTRMHKFAKFQSVLAKMEALPNVMVRRSSDAIDGSYTKGVHGSTIIPDAESVPEGAVRCEAYDHGGKCNGCRACWSKDVPVVAYVAHGVKMKRVIRLVLE